MKELLACPFCQGKAQVCNGNWPVGSGIEYVVIVCANCRASTGRVIVENYENRDKAIKVVVGKWNCRKTMDCVGSNPTTIQ